MKKALVALLFCLVPSSALYPESRDPAIVASPVLIDPDDPARRDTGRLRYLGGWHLTSGQPGFGGYSALHVDGDQFLALADTGDFMRFRMARPGMISEGRFGTLAGFPADQSNRRNRDPESLAIGPEGDAWVAFENQNAILRY
ncbi:MAG: esterase-like activity of phytase family protein, partial [Sphingomonadales bacterium]